jgi:hypothetical protein
MFLLDEYISYYIQRVVHLLCIGTGHKEIWPYKENRQNGLLILKIVMEIWNVCIYTYVYILKIFYEIIYFYDRKPIKEIVKSRIMGYMMVIG